MSSPDQTAPEPPTFLPAYGTAALLCAVFAVVFSRVASIVIDAVRESVEGPADTASMVRGVSIAFMVLFGVMILLALGFGLLSLAGYGKRRGTSRPILGTLGIALAGFMAWVMLGSVQAARHAAARHATEQARNENQPIVDQSIADKPIILAEHGIELARPAGPWLLVTEEEAKRANPLALAGAMTQTRNIEKVIMGLVFVEEVNEREFSGLTPDDWANLVAQSTQLPDVVIEAAESTTFPARDATFQGRDATVQGREAIVVQFTSTSPNGAQIRTRQIIIPDGARVIRLYCAGSVTNTDAEGGAFQPFFEAVTVR